MGDQERAALAGEICNALHMAIKATNDYASQVGKKPRSPLRALFGRKSAPPPPRPEVAEPFVTAMRNLDELIERFRREHPTRFPLLALPEPEEVHALVDFAAGIRPAGSALAFKALSDENTLVQHLSSLHSGLNLTLENFNDIAHHRA
ncbi:MAG TPA: hypothetical protein VHE35_37240 [Kofleriaceae bacterium]|nr:hypothetical protein [Kofleriaceae bacterium]